LTAKILQTISGSLTCVLTFYLGKKIFNTRIGFTAGLITAVYGPLIFYEIQLLATGIATFWVVVLLILFLKAQEKTDYPTVILLGICGGFSVITRSTFLPFFAVGIVWLIVKWRLKDFKTSKIILKLLIIVLLFGLINIPVAWKSKEVTGKFTILPETGGIALYIGNNPDVDKTLALRPGWGWDSLGFLPRQQGLKSRSEAHDYFRKQFVSYVLNNQWEYFKGLFEKSIQFVSSRELPRTYSIYVFGIQFQ